MRSASTTTGTPSSIGIGNTSLAKRCGVADQLDPLIIAETKGCYPKEVIATV